MTACRCPARTAVPWSCSQYRTFRRAPPLLRDGGVHCILNVRNRTTVGVAILPSLLRSPPARYAHARRLHSAHTPL